MSLPNPFPEGIRMSEDRHGIDDLTSCDVSEVRLERMDTNHYWLAIYAADGRRLVIDLMSDRRIEAHWRVDPVFREAVEEELERRQTEAKQ